MMVVQGVQPQRAISVQQTPVEEQPEVVQTTTGIFEGVKKSLLYWWNLFMYGANLAFANTGFIFFRALEFISPTLALRAEGIVLRITNAWQAMQHDRAVDGLLEENAELRWQVRDLTQKSQDRDQLALECTALREENQYLQGMQRGTQEINQQQAQQVQAQGRQRDLVFQENARIRLELQQVQEQLQATREQVQPLIELVQRLQTQLRDAEQAAQDYGQQVEPAQAFYTQVQKIAEACGQVHVAQPTHLDHQLDQLLPLLLGQIGQAQALLNQVKEDLDPHGSAMIAVRSFERILTQMQLSLTDIPVAFKRHTAWQSNIHQLMQIPVQEAY